MKHCLMHQKLKMETEGGIIVHCLTNIVSEIIGNVPFFKEVRVKYSHSAQRLMIFRMCKLYITVT